MSDIDKNNFPPDTNSNGSVLNFYCELPHSLDSEEIGFALFELNNEISSIHEPPVARVDSPFVSFNPDNGIDSVEEYSRFYVEFTDQATPEHMHTALTIIMSAMRRLSNSDQ
jgi:hypothetical protein